MDAMQRELNQSADIYEELSKLRQNVGKIFPHLKDDKKVLELQRKAEDLRIGIIEDGASTPSS